MLTTLEKYYPIVANIHLLLIHFIWKWFNFDIRDYTAILFGFSLIPWLIMLGYSKKHYFCLWHRILLLNILIHGSLYFANYLMDKQGYEMLKIDFEMLILTALALVAATFLYFKDGCYIQKSSKRVKTTSK